MRVDVLLFAAARARVGSSSVAVELAEPATVADLKRALGESFPALAPLLGSSRVGIAAAYANDADPIPPGAEVALIPPVSGGTGP